MTQTRLRLVDGARELELWALDSGRIDVIIDELDVSSPAAREVVEDRADDDGTDDDTQYHGAAAVSLKLKVFDTPEGLLSQIRPFLRFGRRPWLCLSDDEWPGERRIRLRADQWSAPMPYTGLGVWRDCQFQWKAPDGAWVATDPIELTLLGAGGSSVGRLYPAIYPRLYAATQGLGQLTHVNTGDREAHQVVRMYGPCAGPRYSNDDTGETIAFREELVIPAGAYVEVDTRAGTAYYLSDRLAPVLDKLDFAASSWWRLAPGSNRVRYHPSSQVDAGCQAVVTYQPVYLP